MNAEIGLGKWVLITDDSATVCRMLEELLRGLGYASRQLDAYVELPKLLRECPPALVVLDLERPGGLSGPTLGRFIRQYQTRRIPIVVFSSLSLSERCDVCRRIQAEATVGKHEPLDHLRRTLLELLRQA